MLFLGWQKILILGILLRLLVMPFYFHPDIKTYNFQASFLKLGVLNIYSYLEENKSLLPLKEEFVYFPLTYFFLGSYQFLAQPFLEENFSSWLVDASAQASQNTEIFRYLFVLKLPYLFLDLAVAFLLCSLFKEREQKKKAFKLWLFNPFSIFIIYAFGNIDIIVVFLTLFSLYFAQKGQLRYSALMLGLGAGFKAYPLLFLPLLVLAEKDSKKKLQILLTSLIPFLVVIGPFLKTVDFREATLTSGLMTRLTMLGINLGFGEVLMLGVVALSAFFFWGLSEVQIRKDQLWRYFFAVLLIIFPLMHFHIQWILWFLPFSVMTIVYQKRFTFLVITLLSLAFALPLIYDDKAMTVGLLSAVSPLYNLLPTPFIILQKIYDPFFLRSFLHSVFAGGSLILIWSLIKGEKYGE